VFVDCRMTRKSLHDLTTLRTAIVALAAACALSACSSGDGAASTTGSESGPPPLATNAQTACARYFEWDLYRSTRVSGAERATKQGRRQALRDFADLAKRTASAADSAVIVGELPKRSRKAANRISGILSRLVSSGGDIADISGLVDTQLSRPAQRLEAQCAAVGVELPEENLEARN
jgi:hypothetical protein